MYPIHKKTRVSVRKTMPSDDCFAQKAKNWLWILGIIVAGVIVFSIMKLPGQVGQNIIDSSPIKSVTPLDSTHLTGFNPCPYCPGFLDNQGRCNVPRCPLYSPSWDKTSKQKNISQRGMLIKELAMEVNKLTKRGVVIHSVYGGGRTQKAGLEVGDIIVRFNGRRVKNLEQFQSLVAQARPESDVKIQVIRNGRRIKSIIRVGEGEMEGVTTPNQAAPAAWLPGRTTRPGRSYPWCYRR